MYGTVTLSMLWSITAMEVPHSCLMWQAWCHIASGTEIVDGSWGSRYDISSCCKTRSLVPYLANYLWHDWKTDAALVRYRRRMPRLREPFKHFWPMWATLHALQMRKNFAKYDWQMPHFRCSTSYPPFYHLDFSAVFLQEQKTERHVSHWLLQERVGSLKGGVEFLQLCGFQKEGDDFLVIPREKVDPMLLNTAGSELNSAIVNPFFGVL